MDRVRCIDDRVAQAKTKVQDLGYNNGTAIQVYASSKYPVPNGTRVYVLLGCYPP